MAGAAIGLGKWLRTGGSLSLSDAAFLVAYVAALAICGIVVGALWPRAKTRASVLLVGYISGGVLCVLFMGLVEATDRATAPLSFLWQLIIWAYTTLFIGTGIAYIIGRRLGIR